MTWGQFLLAAVLFFVSLLLTLVVLIQRGRGAGLAGAFGGTGSSAFGAKTGDVLTWITCGFAAVFFLLAVVANHVFDYSFERDATAMPVPVEVPAAPGGTTTTIPITPGPDGTITIPAEALQGGAPIEVKIPSGGEGGTPTPPATGEGATPPAPPAETAPRPEAEKPAPPPGENKPAEGGDKPKEDKPSP